MTNSTSEKRDTLYIVSRSCITSYYVPRVKRDTVCDIRCFPLGKWTAPRSLGPVVDPTALGVNANAPISSNLHWSTRFKLSPSNYPDMQRRAPSWLKTYLTMRAHKHWIAKQSEIGNCWHANRVHFADLTLVDSYSSGIKTQEKPLYEQS